MFDRLATSQSIARQTFFAWYKNKMLLKFFKNIAEGILPNGQKLLVKQDLKCLTNNVWSFGQDLTTNVWSFGHLAGIAWQAEFA